MGYGLWAMGYGLWAMGYGQYCEGGLSGQLLCVVKVNPVLGAVIQ